MPCRALAGVGLLFLLSCRSVGVPVTPLAAGAVDPWSLPAHVTPTQRLYSVAYKGPEGTVHFKLTLYLSASDRFRLRASDMGRRLWTLSVEPDGHALLVDHRQHEYCATDRAQALALLPLANLPLVALPLILVGRLPVAPAGGVVKDGARLSYLDERGNTWEGGLGEEGEVEWWTLVERGEPRAWWRRHTRGGRLTDRQGEQEVSWQLKVAEPLTRAVELLEAPSGYRATDCLRDEPAATAPEPAPR